MTLPVVGAALSSAFSALGSAAPAISAATSVISAGAGYAQQKAQADAAEAANERNVQYANDDYAAAQRRAQQEQAATAQKNHQTQIEGMQKRATANVAAGEAGVSGLSVDALLGDITGQEQRAITINNGNLDNSLYEINQQVASGRAARTEQAYSTAVAQPSLFGAVTDATLGVTNAYKDQFKIRGE